MITANEARNAVEDYRAHIEERRAAEINDWLEKISLSIKEYASLGDYEVTLSAYRVGNLVNNDTICPFVVKKLREAGFQVSFSRISMTISWRE